MKVIFVSVLTCNSVLQLMRDGGLEVIDCNNHVKSAINYFGPSCAVNALVDKYNPVGTWFRIRSSFLSVSVARIIPFYSCTHRRQFGQIMSTLYRSCSWW